MAAEVRSTSSTGGQKGVKLARFDLVPVEPLYMLAEHYGAGAKKYADHQWRQGYEWSKSYSAIMRHMAAFWGGEDFDECTEHKRTLGECLYEMDGRTWDDPTGRTCFNHTGGHHLVCVAWHSFTLLEFIDKHPGHDDRFIYKETDVTEREDDLLKYYRERPEELARLANRWFSCLGQVDGSDERTEG